MNPQPCRKKVGKTLQTCSGALGRLQSLWGEAWLPVVWQDYDKLLRNTTSELFQGAFHNYMICTTVLKVWHITRINWCRLWHSSLANASSYSASNFSRTFRNRSAWEDCTLTRGSRHLHAAFYVTALIKNHFQYLYNFYFTYLSPLLLNAHLLPPPPPPASGSAKRHSVLSFDSLKAPHNKCMLVSALLTVQSTLDQIKYSEGSMPLSKQGSLNSQTSKLHNSNITEILERHKNEHAPLLFNVEQTHSYLDRHTCHCFILLLFFLRVFLHHQTSITTLLGSFKGNFCRPKERFRLVHTLL